MPAAYQDQDGKWWKECSSTKQLFGGVDSKEELGEWFGKDENKKDGFRSYCKEVGNEKQRQRYQKNPEKIKEKNILYSQNNREKEKRRHKKYRQENPQKIKEKDKRYYQENSEKIKERYKRYHQTASYFLSKYKSSAKKRGINFTLTKEWFEEQVTKPEFNVCCYTGIEFDKSGADENKQTKPLVRSLDRSSSSKGYTEENFAGWCCYIINSIKGEYSLYQITFVLMLIIDFLCKQSNIDTRLFLNKMLDFTLNSTLEYRKGVLNKEIHPTVHLECENDIAAK